MLRAPARDRATPPAKPGGRPPEPGQRFGNGSLQIATAGDTGELRLVTDAERVYVEYENAAKGLFLAVGGMSMGRVAGTGFEPVTFGL